MSYDYFGNMDYFQNQLTAKGISVDELDMRDYSGLTARELQSIVDHAEYYKHKPKQPAPVVYETYKQAFAEFQPILTRYGFSVCFTQKQIEEQIPTWSNIKDVYTGKNIAVGFEITYGDVKDAQKRFLDTLRYFLKNCCSEQHTMEQKIASTDKRYWQCKNSKACVFCSKHISPALYNRLKGMFYELSYLLQEEKSA